MFLLWFVSVALGADAAMVAEQARAALTEGRPDRARRLAAEAVRADEDEWSAHRLYLKAAAAAGIRTLAEAEFQERAETDRLDRVVYAWWQVSREQEPIERLEELAAEDADPAGIALGWARWRLGDREGALAAPMPSDDPLARRLQLRATLRGDRPRDAVRLGKDWLLANPDHPDVLEEWWDGPDNSAVERAQGWAVKQLASTLQGDPEPLWLLRALRVLAAAREKELARDVVTRLDAAGVARPLAREAWNPAMLHTMGRVLVRQRDPRIPPGTPDERYEMASSLTGALIDRGRGAEAVGMWADLEEEGPSPRVALARARVLTAMDRPDEALEAANLSAAWVGHPQPDDVALLRTARQAVQLAEAHGYMAELHLTAGRPVAARVHAWIASALDPHPQWSALWAKALAADDGVDGDLEPVLVEASRLAPGTDGELHDTVIARLASQGRAAPLDEALHALAIAVQLAPLSTEVHAARAARLAEAGHTEAAFVARAVAGEGPEVAWEGLGSPPQQAALQAWRTAVKVQDARIAELHPLPEDESGPTDTAGATRARVRTGHPMPPWSVSVGPTVFDNDSTAGNALVLTLWASWCGPCKLEMPEIDQVVGELASEGLPVTGVAISIDENEKLFRKAKARRRYEALVVGWNPTIGKELRVAALPTTWIIAPDGTVVHFQTGYDELFVAKLERLLRKHAPTD